MPESYPVWFRKYPWRRALLFGVALGAFLALIYRWLFQTHLFDNHSGTGLIVSISFLFVAPLVVGFVTMQYWERSGPRSIDQWIFAPWLPILVSTLFLWLCRREGLICILMALPIMLVCASIGGVAAGLLARRGRRLRTTTLSSLALLPILLAPAESLHTAPTQTRTVHSQILIHAPASVIWHNIERVPAIAPAELRPNWTHRIGFPRPVEATLSYEGVGGVRNASFEHGLLFFETVTAWEPDHRLAFRIQADTAHIPPTTLDEHVTIGGRYFDVLDGEYSLEPLASGNILLHLTSHQRLSTDLNGYAGLWTDAVMQSLQRSILEVIQHRCDSQGTAATLAQPNPATQ